MRRQAACGGRNYAGSPAYVKTIIVGIAHMAGGYPHDSVVSGPSTPRPPSRGPHDVTHSGAGGLGEAYHSRVVSKTRATSQECPLHPEENVLTLSSASRAAIVLHEGRHNGPGMADPVGGEGRSAGS